MGQVLVIIAKCVDANYNVREDFLGLVDVHDASSAGQKNLIMKCLLDLGIPIQNLMGIGFDNASVNTGSVKGLGVLLKEEVPNLFILGCTSNSLALCATYAAKKLPEGLEVFIHDFVNYIVSSPKRQDELKKCQEICTCREPPPTSSGKHKMAIIGSLCQANPRTVECTDAVLRNPRRR